MRALDHNGHGVAMPSVHDQMRKSFAVPQHQEQHGVSVTLASGSNVSDAFDAQYCDTEYESVEFETGLNVKRRIRDWYLLKTDCVIDSQTVEPTAGMVITAEGVKYELCPVPGKPAVEEYASYEWLCHSQEATQ